MTRVDCTISLRNRQTETEQLCVRLAEFGSAAGLSKKSLYAINLAIEELFTNVVSYGYPDKEEHVITISLVHENDRVTIRMEDDGGPFDPVKVEAPDLTCPVDESIVGGLGVHIVKQMMDDIRYERTDEKNIVTMTKKLSNE